MTKNIRSYFKLGCAAFGALALLLLIAGGVLFARVNQSEDTLTVSGESDIYYDDLTIESDDLYNGDVILYSGDLKIESGGEIQGALVVYSGDITIDSGASVAGDVVGFSGDADIAGHVGGDLVVWSGDIHLEESATIDGDVSVMSGDIHRTRGAVIAGNIISGPKLPKLPPILTQLQLDLPTFAGGTTIVEAVPPPVASGMMNNFTRFALRLVAAAFITGLVVLVTSLAFYLQPTFIGRLQSTLTTQRPISFVIGLILNIFLIMFMMLAVSSEALFLAICLAPLSLLALLLFLILNTGGWAALSLTIGKRLLAFANMRTTQPLLNLLTGATAMTGTLTFVWALGGCMRPIAYLAMLTLSALGGGALILQHFQKRRDDGSGNGGSEDDSESGSQDQPVMV